MRAFFCIPLTECVRRRVARTASRLRAQAEMHASWVRPENYHLTIRFLGEIDPALTGNLDRLAVGVAGETGPFDVSLDRLGGFPSLERARVLWAGGDAPAEYTRLVEAVNDRLRDLGFGPERKATIAHVTLARIKGRPDPKLRSIVEHTQSFDAEQLRVDRLVLMESRLTPSGAIYELLSETRLGERR